MNWRLYRPQLQVDVDLGFFAIRNLSCVQSFERMQFIVELLEIRFLKWRMFIKLWMSPEQLKMLQQYRESHSLRQEIRKAMDKL